MASQLLIGRLRGYVTIPWRPVVGAWLVPGVRFGVINLGVSHTSFDIVCVRVLSIFRPVHRRASLVWSIQTSRSAVVTPEFFDEMSDFSWINRRNSSSPSTLLVMSAIQSTDELTDIFSLRCWMIRGGTFDVVVSRRDLLEPAVAIVD